MPRQAQAAPTSGAPTAAQLEALSGEYTDPNEPDTPISFYVQNGKLVYENERRVPTELRPVSKSVSSAVFGIPDTKVTLRFTLDATGTASSPASSPASSLVFSDNPDAIYRRTGLPVHHFFHDYQRTEVMIPMRDGVKLHAVILKPADIAAPLPFLIQRTPYGVDETNRASFFVQPPGAGPRRLHLRR